YVHERPSPATEVQPRVYQRGQLLSPLKPDEILIGGLCVCRYRESFLLSRIISCGTPDCDGDVKIRFQHVGTNTEDWWFVGSGRNNVFRVPTHDEPEMQHRVYQRDDLFYRLEINDAHIAKLCVCRYISNYWLSRITHVDNIDRDGDVRIRFQHVGTHTEDSWYIGNGRDKVFRVPE